MKLLSSVNIETSENVDINLSPLIDMVFLLLIFFMVTTVFVDESGLDIERPAAATARQLSQESIIISITPNDKIHFGGREIAFNNVQSLVARMLRNQERPVVILADKASQTGILVDVIDQCKLAGAKSVSIATEEP